MSEPNWVALGGGGVDYVGGWAAGTAYKSGDVVRHNGIEYLAVNPSTGQTPAPSAGLAAGKELAYLERTTNFTAAIIANNAVIGPTPAVTFDGVTPVDVEFFLGYQDLVSGGTGSYILLMDATNLGYICVTKTQQMMTGRYHFTPPAGSHTFSVQLNASHVHTLYAGPGGVAAGYPPMFIRVSQAQPTQVAVRTFTAPGIGTTLPASPVDGDEYILVDSLTAPTYQWHFRYVAGTADAYKWWYIGGAPAFNRIETAEACTSTSFTDLATVGPQVTLPRSGWYDAEVHARITGAAAQFGIININYQGGDLTGPTIGVASQYIDQGRRTRFQADPATVPAKMMYRIAGTSVTFDQRNLTIWPVRVR